MATRRLFDGAQIELELLPIVGSGSTSYNLSLSKGDYTLTGKDATLILTTPSVSYSLTANKGAYNLIGKNVSLKTNFLVVYHYVSPSFNLYRLRVYTGGVWKNVVLYKYKNSNWNEFTK
jgi:hypothetical protein